MASKLKLVWISGKAGVCVNSHSSQPMLFSLNWNCEHVGTADPWNLISVHTDRARQELSHQGSLLIQPFIWILLFFWVVFQPRGVLAYTDSLYRTWMLNGDKTHVGTANSYILKHEDHELTSRFQWGHQKNMDILESLNIPCSQRPGHS